MGLALAMELNGALDEPTKQSALQSLVRAGQLAGSLEDTIAVGVATTRVHVRRGDFASAATTAATLLNANRNYDRNTATMLAPLAALLGRQDELANLEYRIATSSTPSSEALLPWLGKTYSTALAEIAVGKCARHYENLVAIDSGIATQFAVAEVRQRREELLPPILRLGVTCGDKRTLSMLRELIPSDRAAIAAIDGDRFATRAALAELARSRENASASAVAWDQEFTESWILLQLGDTASASRRLTNSLNNLGTMSELTFNNVALTAGLRRGLELAAALAKARGDSARASKWQQWLRDISAAN
jgi:hypothetical protein